MKINDKNLAAFAASPTPIDREGWLSKKSDVNKSIQRRWFVLKGNLLFYFERKGDKEPLGVIILEGCTIELAEDGESYSFAVTFHGGRAYRLCAESQDAMEQWMKALACATYDYMKLMVADLQRQLQQLQEAEEQRPEGETGEGPRAPARAPRHNPFNRDAGAKAVYASRHNREREGGPGRSVSFRELHAAYGRRVLADHHAWRARHALVQL